MGWEAGVPTCNPGIPDAPACSFSGAARLVVDINWPPECAPVMESASTWAKPCISYAVYGE